MIKTNIYFLFIFNLLFSSCQKNNESIFNKAATENGLIGGIVTIFSAENQNQYFPFGLANFSNKKTINDSTYFRVASISKMVTAIAFMQLVDKNLVQLDDDVNAILEYNVVNPNHVNITITPRMLLSHTSTLVDNSNYFDFLEKTFSSNIKPLLSNVLKGSSIISSELSFMSMPANITLFFCPSDTDPRDLSFISAILN